MKNKMDLFSYRIESRNHEMKKKKREINKYLKGSRRK